MSLDLSVPILQPLSLEELSATTATFLKTILHRPILQNVELREVTEGTLARVMGPVLPGHLYTAAVEGFSDNNVEFIAINNPFELADLYPSAIGCLQVSARAARISILASPVAAALASAAASLQNTVVVDDGRNWSNQVVTSPIEFVKQLSLSRDLEDMQAAAKLFCAGMNKPVDEE
jgi:hypothetical protein